MNQTNTATNDKVTQAIYYNATLDDLLELGTIQGICAETAAWSVSISPFDTKRCVVTVNNRHKSRYLWELIRHIETKRRLFDDVPALLLDFMESGR